MNCIRTIVFISYICLCSGNVDLETKSIITLNKSNTVFINEEINEESMSKAIFKITHIETNEIYIYIDSLGGDVKQGNKFIEVLEYYSEKKNIYCIVSHAASMAFIILQRCPNRYATPSSVLMQHNIKITLINYENKNVKNYIDYIDDIENNLIEQQIKRLKMDKKKFIQLVSNDWWLSGTQALAFNVVDKLVIVGCDTKLNDTYKKIHYETINNNMIKITKTFSLCPLIKKPITIDYNQV